jgi:4-hydroxybenzoate polyprenyltransferase
VTSLSLSGPTAFTRAPAGPVILAWKEARPVVQMIFQIRFQAAALLAVPAGDGFRPGGRLVVGGLAWLFTTWHVYLLNGLSDQVTDRHNGSARPLASDQLGCGPARAGLGVLAALALGLGALGGRPLLLLVTAMLLLGYGYSAGPRPMKASAAGSILVILAGGLATYAAGWYAGGGGAPTAEFLIVAGAMSAWMALAGMAKDLPDVAGDRAAGRRTLPILLGERPTRWLISAFAVIVAAVALTASWRTGRSPVFALALAGGAAVMVARLIGPEPGHRRRPYRAFMATQYAAHLAVIAECVG